MATLVYRARWVIPVSRPGWENGWIEVHDGLISRMGAGTPPAPAIDLGSVAVLPALVNAHTHLEYSELTRPLGKLSEPFADWISEVIAWKRSIQPQLLRDEKRSAVLAGIAESWGCGIGLIGEIATEPWSPEWYEHPWLEVRAFHELIGASPARAAAAWSQWESQVERYEVQVTPTVSLGLSPHATYTVTPELAKRAAAAAAQRNIPIAMHLAESREELEWLANQTGPLRTLLEGVGAWSAETWSNVKSADDYLQAMLGAPRVAVIHANYLSDSQFDWLSEHRHQYTIVHCPRTHAFFGHDQHPIDQLSRRGMPWAIGTDSRASNPDLSIWSELTFAAERHPQIEAEQWLRSATLVAADLLGKGDSFGTLEPGRRWLPCVIELSADAPAKPEVEYLLLRNSGRPQPLASAPSGMPRFA